MKFSDTPEKLTNPGFKTTYRIYGGDGMAAADLIALRSERFDETKPLTIFHPLETWKKTTFTDYRMRDLMVQVFDRGKQVYELPPLKEIIAFAARSREEFWEEYKRRVNPHRYKVDLSDGLYALKQSLLRANQEH